MKRMASLVIAAVCISLAGIAVCRAAEHRPAPYTGTKEFERMKHLVGTWEGTSDMGKEGEKVKVEYRLTAGDSALVETLNPGRADEMISVYHDRRGQLAMTHYCMFHNQPRMSLTKADAQTIELVFSGRGNDLDPEKEKHMHAVRFTFTDKDHLIQKWTLFEKGKEAGVVTFTLTRVR